MIWVIFLVFQWKYAATLLLYPNVSIDHTVPTVFV